MAITAACGSKSTRLLSEKYPQTTSENIRPGASKSTPWTSRSDHKMATADLAVLDELKSTFLDSSSQHRTFGPKYLGRRALFSAAS